MGNWDWQEIMALEVDFRAILILWKEPAVNVPVVILELYTAS